MVFVEVCGVTDVPEGQGKPFTVNGKGIALFNIEGDFYAVFNTCPHQDNPLDGGTIEDLVLSCPFHGWQFDVKTGKHLTFPNVGVPVYETKVEAGKVFVDL
ncbi:MAG: non-heme iron oxygenase ferredoxin subunit [archaeon]|nr:non-heme iron oxygenase ferredoxin subunit [archaeon]